MEELQRFDIGVVDAEKADVWIYRTANASDEDYFSLSYATPMRTPGPVPPGRLLVATGLGPSVDPGAAGGRSADILISGDEMCGRLLDLFLDLSASPFSAEDFFRHRGVALRAGTSQVLVSRLDRRFILTSAGLCALPLEPSMLRRVYSVEYDRFLCGYFSRSADSTRPSFLLLTSRGCGARCSICCSGGHIPWVALSPRRIGELLSGVLECLGGVRNEPVDLFILDSYFNRDPRRVIELSRLFEREGMTRRFIPHVRHSGLIGFLRPDSGSGRRRVDRDLIAAYRRLGIQEVVLGIDAWTERSIRDLKTDTHWLERDGAAARPAYRPEEIERVITALDRAGLQTRCFLLVGSPFADDADLVETFYRILGLCLVAPGFRIDLDPSGRICRLKPFPGAPITQAARSLPGTIGPAGFVPGAKIPELETSLPFIACGYRRQDEASAACFWREIGRGRLAVATLLLDLIGSDRRHDARTLSAVAAARPFIAGERRLARRRRTYSERFPATSDVEDRIVARLRQLARAARGRADDPVPRRDGWYGALPKPNH